ncbi:MAG: response regulator [Synechococcaceae cyanobacterium SM2_3_1]|nr:response regulator [Synechococcaceae cyanobacterium SM2_3_1]
MNLVVFASELGIFGAMLETAQSSAEAIELITSQQFDALVYAIGLPITNGYELMQQIRALPIEQGGQIPAIALTAYSTPIEAQKAIEAGFQYYLAKPIAVETLVNALERFSLR